MSSDDIIQPPVNKNILNASQREESLKDEPEPGISSNCIKELTNVEDNERKKMEGQSEHSDKNMYYL